MITVAIIEDLKSYRDALKTILDGTPEISCIGVYDNAETSLRYLPKDHVDVALIDIHLPGMNGIQLVKCLRELVPKTLCLVCTAYDEDELVFNALQSGAHGYILKSIPPHRIIESILDLKNGGSPMSNEIARKVVMSFQRSSNPEHEYHLTKREKEILALLSNGLLYKEIAATLFVSLDTVKRHCFNIYTKLHVKNKTEAINRFFGNHLR
jgi:NarL family two-component system response regulator LiaR